MADQAIEFVPHLAHKAVPLPDGRTCYFDQAPLCTAGDLDAALAPNAPLKTKYLMGWNEAWDQDLKAGEKYIVPATAATWWGGQVQGLAARHNLTLVSPTTGVDKHKLQWFGDMLLACRAQQAQGCDVETIAAFSVHDYRCSETYWRDNYAAGNGTFQRTLKAYLAAGGRRGQDENADDYDWNAYVDARRIWVTETNCNGDTGFPSTGLVNRKEQCARITGQRADQDCGQFGKCGIGSIATLERMSSVGRVAWWNTWQHNRDRSPKTHNAMLVDAWGRLHPAGRALAGGLSKSIDCDVAE